MGAITVKGQVTIPKHVRDALGIRPGDQVEFDLLPDGGARLRTSSSVQRHTRANWDRFRGIGRSGMTTDEIMRMTRGDPADDPAPVLSDEVLALLRAHASGRPD